MDLSNLKVKLKGSLSLDGFVKLNKLECQNNLLERLVIPDSCFRLTHLDCSGNLLTDLSFLNQSCLKNKLIYLDISDNNFFNKIICFKHFVSLEVLKINAVDLDKQIGGIYEYFYHHLKENKGIINLKKLKEEDHFGLVDVEKKLNEQEVLKKDLLIKQLIKKLENEELSSSRKAQIIEIVEKTNLSESCSSLEDERKFFNELISNVSNNTTQGERMTQITYICNYGQLSTGSNITFFSNQSNQTTYQIQYNIQQPQKELNELKQKYQVLESAEKQNNQSDQQKLKKAVLFLGAKQIFADTRQDTIKKIINTYKELDESGQKFDKVKTVGEHISSAK